MTLTRQHEPQTLAQVNKQGPSPGCLVDYLGGDACSDCTTARRLSGLSEAVAQAVAAGQHGRVTALQLTCKDHRLGRLESWQALHRPPAEMPGVPHPCRLRRLHACDDVPHLACAQAPRGHRLWRQDTNLQGHAMLSACFAVSFGQTELRQSQSSACTQYRDGAE